MTTGELIRALSHWAPDTDISVIGPNGEAPIGTLITRDDNPDLTSEVALTVVE